MPGENDPTSISNSPFFVLIYVSAASGLGCCPLLEWDLGFQMAARGIASCLLGDLPGGEKAAVAFPVFCQS